VGRGLAIRIAIAALVTAGLGMAILVVGVLVVGAETFENLMLESGDTADHARAMYDESVTRVTIGASVVALATALLVAVILGKRIARPLAATGAAARRVAHGDYGTRVAREGPEELWSLADSFNQMATALEDQERIRRDFIANAAHELRTPLTNLQGYLEALRDGVIGADRETYQSLWEEAERLVRLSHSIDALAEGDAARAPAALEELDLAVQIDAAIALAGPAIDRAGLTLVRHLPPLLPGRANPDQLKQILDNLLTNAVRYTPRGGQIRVQAGHQAGDIIIAISNSGQGIPKADLPRIFERFYRVEKSRDRAHGGAGIGLAIVKQLVEATGGRVGAESAGGWTRIWFSLPA
jgi:two-component system, OmpR family, sensor histidine kinase BaeS